MGKEVAAAREGICSGWIKALENDKTLLIYAAVFDAEGKTLIKAWKKKEEFKLLHNCFEVSYEKDSDSKFFKTVP